jgi:predicted DNA-binding helix-hairpin-helix protein
MGWALRNITQFPVIQHAPLEILRVPGIVSNQHINCVCTPFSKSIDGTPQIGVSVNRAVFYFR